jgi:hypothetical protein
MKVHQIKTPEYESENFRDVYDLLSSFDGALEFVASDYKFNYTEFNFLEFTSFKNETGVKQLLFEIEMKNLCHGSNCFLFVDITEIYLELTNKILLFS